MFGGPLYGIAIRRRAVEVEIYGEGWGCDAVSRVVDALDAPEGTVRKRLDAYRFVGIEKPPIPRTCILAFEG